ncbi:pyruvoyl-dependent arginine decarboxylase [Halovenus rubra]|uniref:Pyruvoyl-dependent arginine decarboxylase n=2 Tax=Halovenus rubra TaxID=869890 RepID=A0ACC7DWG1_9EURY|nr:pyruvoyl-dependent arginine decarboxylase [Halovenus rubra]
MIRIVWGLGTAGTEKASFDEALAAANVHQYNLRELSSVIPASVSIDTSGTAPDLGPTGNALDAVLARKTSPPDTRAAAGLAWARSDDGPGIFYEAAGTDTESVRERLVHGVEHGCELRDMNPDIETKVVTAEPAAEQYSTAVVLAVYGESEPLL